MLYLENNKGYFINNKWGYAEMNSEMPTPEKMNERVPAVYCQEDVMRAMDFAEQYHHGQSRMGANGRASYFDEHIMGVYNILKEECRITDCETLIVALLHDTVEDTTCTFKDIEESFGEDIMHQVELLTRKEGEPFSDYATRLFDGATGKVVLIKMADRLHNLRTILYMPDKKWIEKKLGQTYTDILDRLDSFSFGEDEDFYRENSYSLAKKIKEQIAYINEELKK